MRNDDSPAATRGRGTLGVVVAPFKELLRKYRTAAVLTQEALAEKAGLSVTAIAALEQGRRRAPRLSTVRELGRALQLDDEELRELAAAASGAVTGDSASSEEGGSRRRTPAPTPPPSSVRAVPLPGPPSDPDDVPPQLRPRRRTTFVGRTTERDLLVRAWADRARFVVITGEAGVGKSRLVGELAAYAHAEGATLGCGCCRELGPAPLLPFGELLRALVHQTDPERLGHIVRGSGEMERLVPTIRDLVPDLPRPVAADPSTEQRLLFDAVASFLGRCGRILVVVEDLHWSDPITLAMLSHLAADQSLDDVTVVLTARETAYVPQLPGLLAHIQRTVGLARLRLTGLDKAAVFDLVTGLLGEEVTPALGDWIVEVTDGNPFLAEELTTHLLDTGIVSTSGRPRLLPVSLDGVGLPDLVRSTLGSRVDALTPDARHFVWAGAVLGREFDVYVAGATAGLEASVLIDASDDVLLSGLVTESSASRMAFSHALVHSAVLEGISSVRRIELHRRAARVLEQRHDEEPNVATEIARHWAEVVEADPTAAAAAATWAVRAGDAALALAAADEAIEHYEVAARLLTATTHEHADTMIRLATALLQSGRGSEADERFEVALQLSVALRDRTLLARAALGLGETTEFGVVDGKRIAALEQALDVLGEDDEALRTAVMGSLATQLAFDATDSGTTRRRELAASVFTIADNPTVPDEVLIALGRSRLYGTTDVGPVVVGRVGRRIADVATGRHDQQALSRALFLQAASSLDLGQMDDLRAAVRLFTENARRIRVPEDLGFASLMAATVALIEGRYDDAAVETERCRVHSVDAHNPNSLMLHVVQSIIRSVDIGDAASAYHFLHGLEGDPTRVSPLEAGAALCAAMAGEFRDSRQLVERFARFGFGRLRWTFEGVASLAFLAQVCAMLDLTEHAGPVAEALGTTVAPVVRIGPVAGWWGTVDHHLGCLLRVLGRLDEARAALERALALETAMDARPFMARTSFELAQVLDLEAGPGERERAADLRQAGVALATDVGAHGLLSAQSWGRPGGH